MDKSFPRAGNPRSRSCPPRLKVFVGASSSYEEGIDFVAKVAKLLVAGLGTSSKTNNDDGMDVDDTTTTTTTSTTTLSEGTNDVLRFLSFATPYFNPSNLGSWTFTLGAFLHYFAYELCCRVGAAAGLQALHESHPAAAQAYAKVQPGPAARPIPPHEIVAILHALLPLCQQALYSKNGHVGRAGEAAMLYLVQMDPVHTTPGFMEFAIRALDIQAVNLSHQAPSALSALTRLVQPALRSDNVWLMRLPEMLRLSLAGVDSNDQNKTLRTLIFYRSLTSWVPVGGSEDEWPTLQLNSTANEEEDQEMISDDGTMRLGPGLFANLERARNCQEYKDAIAALPESSLLRTRSENDDTSSPEMRDIIVAEAMSAMSDWALEFLDRVYGLLRASGEREKTGKTTSGVASRHSSADVHAARNFSRVLKESLMQLFAAMSDDVHELAVRSVRRFLEDESLPAAAKDASFLCQAVAAARESSKKPGEVSSRGLESLLEVLTDDLAHHSTKTVVYRLRCLAGAVRQAGAGVVKHRQRIGAAIDFALKSQDRHIFKTGCKVLRHVLSTLSESYPLLSDSRPRAYTDGTTKFLGRSAQLHGDAVKWHVPDKECVTFIYELLQNHVIRRLDACSEDTGDGMGRRSRMLNSVDIQALRQCLRVVRYSIRGGASVLVDHVPGEPLQKEDDFVPYEMAGRRLLSLADEDSRNSILSLRMRISSFLVVLSAVVASDTLYPDAVQGLPESDPYRKMLPLISSDPKVCKETCLIALLLLTRRGASFRSQEARTIWKAQKQLATDFPLSAQVDQMAESLQCASLYGKGVSILYKDGENAGKTIPRRLLVGRIRLFHDSLQRNASFEVPRRLRRAASGDSSRQILFSVKGTLPEMLEYLETILPDSTPRPLDAYEGISDGLCALCCHSNTQVRASAIGVIDYAVTRFAWLLGPRVSRLMSAIELKDDGMNGKFGFPSCAMLVEKVNQQGKRKRLAEAIKGVCSILSLARSIKQLLVNERMRFRFAQTMCGTDGLIALLPAEEVQKVVHYLHAVFSPFRSKVYYLPRISKSDRESYIGTMSFGNDILAEKKSEANGDSESVAVHWRKLLLACWFLLTLVDGDDRDELLDKQYERTWDTCIRILETESGQPLQRVGLGLFGRLTFLAKDRGENIRQLREKMATESFCKVLADAIMFDHREDASIGGGHDAQWSAGVEDIIRDSSRNIAPRTLFPFQRTSQSLGSFKVSHSQLVECVLNSVDKETGRLACGFLLSTCREMAAAPPSEDQRNLQITSAEIFSGICGYLLRNSYGDCGEDWRNVLLPYLDEVMGKIPFSLSSAYFDALRYALQFSAPKSFYPLTEWLVDKVLSTLWQPQHGRDEDSEGHTSSGHGTEGFTAQSKWLYLISAVLIEIDDSEVDGSMSRTSWYESQLVENCSMEMDTPNRDLEVSWNMIVERLLPRLVSALGHPFDSCRDHISRCLFRICYCHRKRERIGHSRAPSRSNSMVSLEGLAKAEDDPGASVVEKLATLHQNEGLSFNDKYNALSTARRFMSYCVHLGEAKFEYSDYVIPLLPVAFEALKSTMEDEVSDAADTSEESAAKRALEAEVIKAYRYMIAEVSVTAVISYGRGVDIARVLDVMEASQHHEKWQVRHAVANFLRCFQGAHKFLFSDVHSDRTMNIVAGLLADERREVSSAAMAALTGILAASPAPDVGYFVKKYATLAGKSKVKRQKKSADSSKFMPVADANGTVLKKEERRAKNQQTSVFFLCAAVMSQPYDTPAFVPVALAAISKHSFERNAPLGVRDTVKKCCAEYKRTHMSDNWDLHRQKFTQEQLEALEDVVSSPHYYA